MNNQELLQEHRGMGWPDITQSMRSADRQRFADKIAQFRRDALANPAEYRANCEREESRFTTLAVRKSNPLPASMIVETLKQTLDRQARQIREDSERERLMTDFSAVGQDNFRHYVEDRFQSGQAEDPQQSLRCGSLTSSREDHAWGAEAHANIARKLCDRKTDGWADAADRHYAASAAHRAAASAPDTPDYVQIAGRAVGACLRCFAQPSATAAGQK
jgi:hypothetical protein